MIFPTYVVITAARNEVALIGRTLDAMVAQTIRPARWVIVSDGSTDGTDELVLQRAAAHPWIELLRMQERSDRHFGAKANCVNAGYAHLKTEAFDIVANLDADVSFDGGYFSFLLSKFVDDDALGVAGTAYEEDVAGKVVVFKLGTQQAQATTNATGVAATTLKLTQKNGQYLLTATWTPVAGDDTRWTGASTSATFTVGGK